MSDGEGQRPTEGRPVALDYATPEKRKCEDPRAIVAAIAALIAFGSNVIGITSQSSSGFIIYFNWYVAAGWLVSSVTSLLMGIVVLRCSQDQQSRKMAKFALVVTGIAVLIGLVVLLSYQPLQRHARARWSSSRCSQNLSHVQEALDKYRQRNGGQFPKRLEDLVIGDLVWPEALVCPATNHTPASGSTPSELTRSFAQGQHNSYVYVGGGLPASPPPGAVVLYEPLGQHATMGTIHVLWADGWPELVDEARAKKLIAELESGHNPPRREATE